MKQKVDLNHMTNSRNWFYFPIEIPLTEDNQGPCSIKEAYSITYEVWDQFCNSYESFDCLPDAINLALKMNIDKCFVSKSGLLYDPDLCGDCSDE